MDKISISDNFQNNLKSRQEKLREVRQYIEKKSGFKLESIRFSKNIIIGKAINNYESAEINIKLQKYFEENNIKVF